jgi:hypothetical protein
MIYESRFWKDDLLKQARSLLKKSTQKRWTENTYFRFEQTVMLGFYSVRKLVEAKKISDMVAEQRVNLSMYKHKDEWNPTTLLNKRKIDKLYNLNEEEVISRNLRFLCNRLVHSYVFEERFDDESGLLLGIFFNSDKDRNKALYYIEIQKIIDIFEQVGSDYPTEVHYTANFKTMDYDVTGKTDKDVWAKIKQDLAKDSP